MAIQGQAIRKSRVDPVSKELMQKCAWEFHLRREVSVLLLVPGSSEGSASAECKLESYV